MKLIIPMIFVLLIGSVGASLWAQVKIRPAATPTPKPAPTAAPKSTRTTPRTAIPPSRPVCDSFTENLNGVKLEMVNVPADSFLMGSPNDERGRSDAEGPQHRVNVPAFAIGKYEVTQAQWRAVMGNNPSHFKGPDLPVEMVTWNDAQEFCRKLSQMTGKTYRLPSEAEWEYARRAGTTGAYAGDLTSIAWYDGNSGGKTHPVGQKQPNAFGLYDMAGNVWEWCEDDWHGSYNGAPNDGRAWMNIPARTSQKVIRGGCQGSGATTCYSAYRSSVWSSSYDFVGFRLVRTCR